ncbi:alpha-glucosidase/alpha-galactosidase, partial [bacterium]
MPRPVNVLMVGAGSFFTNSVLKDVILIPDNVGGELRLVDIDPERLALTERLIHKILGEVGQDHKWTVVADTDRRKLIPGIDYLINSIEVSGVECVRFDNDIPLEFGVSQNIGDTIGPGGLMKALRTVPVFLDILRDVRELAPKAVVMNYTNPMNVLCLAAARAVPEVPVVGLCHSVQGTGRMLAGYANVPYEQVQWKCAGINHLAWFTEFNGPDGGSLYPTLMAQAEDRDSAFSREEPVRTDMMRHFGAFITESSGHL